MAVSTTSLLPHSTQKEDKERFQENLSPYQDQLVLLHLGLSLVPWQKPSPQRRGQQVSMCDRRCTKAGRITQRPKELPVNQHKTDNQTSWGFKQAGAMAEAQSLWCFFDYWTAILRPNEEA